MSIVRIYNTLGLVADWLKPGTKQGVINADIIGLGAAGYVQYGSAIIGFRGKRQLFLGPLTKLRHSWKPDNSSNVYISVRFVGEREK